MLTMASLLTPATFIVWSQTQLLFSRSMVSKHQAFPKPRHLYLSLDRQRSSKTIYVAPMPYCHSQVGTKSPCTDPAMCLAGTVTTWKSARTSPGFTKVSTEGSPCQKDMTPSEKPFLLAITKTLGAQTQACQEQRHTCNLQVCSQFVERESLICSHIS